ncbi:outer membrane beta-barrel protein [Pontibacter sp. SGAir0037]|uniref:outer membrane beta-barrel protein n=1 Tax=Pontibacter sp. SGAir0037 TaxID=2571030 RepID=UPI0010FA5333|nr:outer membrane beta-barrel protein [Pontibacter sp. SGAir0037]
MKKVILLLIAVLCYSNLQAQISKGSIALTGTLAYSYSTYEDRDASTFQKVKNYELGPSVGIFIKDNLEVGANFNFGRERISNDRLSLGPPYTSDDRYRTFSYNAYAKQYLFLLDKIALHAVLSVGYNKTVTQFNSIYTGTSAIPSRSNESDSRYFSAGVSPGITCFISPKFALNLNLGLLGFSKTTYDSKNVELLNGVINFQDDYTSKSNSFNFDFSSATLNYGLTYYLGRQ